MQVNKEAALLIKFNKVKEVGSTTTREGRIKQNYEVEGSETHKVSLWDESLHPEREPKGQQVAHRAWCTCTRGSMINPTNNTDCKHIRAVIGYDILKELNKLK